MAKLLSPEVSLVSFGESLLTVNVNRNPSTPNVTTPPPDRIQYNIVDPIKSFTGREQILEKLHKDIQECKSTDNGTVWSQTTVITGIGGLGKTETVRKYVLKYKGDYGHILWINAEKYTQAKDCFKAIASLFYIPSKNFDSRRSGIVDQIFEIVCTGEKPCLIVFDNAESMGTADSREGIQPFLPSAIKPGWKKPTILVTSRCIVWEKAGLVVQLSGLSDKECFDLLAAHLKLPDTPGDRKCAQRITNMSDGLPLVVQQVVAIIRLTSRRRVPLGKSAYTMEDFLSEVKQDGLDFTKTDPADSPVRSTAFQIFKMAFKRILEQENGVIAFRCLSVMALLNPDGIPAKLLTALIAPITTDETALAGALNMLGDQNLVTLLNGSYRIHRIVQLVSIRFNSNKCETGDTGGLKSKVKGIGKAIRGTPKFCFTSANILTSIIPPFLECLEKIPLKEDSLNVVIQNGLQIASHLKKHSEVEGNISFLEALAEKLVAAGKFSEVENIWKDLLGIYASIKGTSAEKLYAMSQLAWACLQQGKNDAALKIYKEVLETKESELGTDHQDTLSTKDMMAAVYTEQGKYDDAIALHEYVLKNEEIKFGSNDSRTAATKNNLAIALIESGKYERAFELYNDVLKYEELQLGPNHHLTLSTKHNLAGVLRQMGKYDEAVKMFEDTLKGMESELGRNHRDTLRTKSSLANALNDKREDQRAFQLYEDTLKAQVTHFAPDDAHTLITKHNFALLHKKLEKVDTAVEMFKDVYETQEKVLGPNHPSTISTKKVLADTLAAKGEYKRASELYEEVLRFQHSSYAPNSPETLKTKSRLAYSYKRIGKYGAAMKIYQQILEHQETSLGPNHPSTLTTIHDMAWNLRKQGRYDEALKACEDILNSLKQAPDVLYDETMGVKDEIARIYAYQGKNEDAVELFEEVLEHYTKEFGENDSFVKRTEQRLREAREKANWAGELDRNVTS